MAPSRRNGKERALPNLYAILVAGGNGARVGGPLPKQFLSLRGRPILDWSLLAFRNTPEVAGIVIVAPEAYCEDIVNRLKKENLDDKVLAVVAGGSSRQESVRFGLSILPSEIEWVAVHDAVRPFVTPQLIQATFTLAQQAGAAVPSVAIHDTLIQVDENNLLVRPISRDAVRRSQTPQIFRADILGEAHRRSHEEGLLFTDDATLAVYYGFQVASFVHYGENRKITTPQDLEKITMQKSAQTSSLRCGQGFDVHPFAEGRPLILGGVRFASDRGLLGHSDADVLCHAVCDALLGAAALGDIGQHFPVSDPAYRNVSSLVLLGETAQMLQAKGYEIAFIDATLIGDQPKIASRRDEMREKIAGALSIDPDCVSVKATTTEGMGFTGDGQGLAASAIATIQLAAGGESA